MIYKCDSDRMSTRCGRNSIFVQGMYGGTLRKRGEREAKVGMRASFWLAH